jgi:hypothetical protein
MQKGVGLLTSNVSRSPGDIMANEDSHFVDHEIDGDELL